MREVINKKQTGKNIKKARISSNYSTKELADLICYSESMVNRLERGDMIPTTNSLVFISHFTKTSIEELLATEWDDDPKFNSSNRIYVPVIFNDLNNAPDVYITNYQDSFRSYILKLSEGKSSQITIGISNDVTLMVFYSNKQGFSNFIMSIFKSSKELHDFLKVFVHDFNRHITFKKFIFVYDYVDEKQIEIARIEFVKKNGEILIETFDGPKQKCFFLEHNKKK